MFKGQRRTSTIFLFLSLLAHSLVWLALIISPPTPKPHAPEQVEVEFVDAPKTPPEEAKQIVTQDQQQNQEIDEKAKFLSAFNQKVEKQTRVNRSGDFNNAKMAGAKSSARPSAPQFQSEDKGQGDNKAPTLASLKPEFNPHPVAPTVPGDDGQSNKQSATDDYLKDVPTGMETMLSTREFVYYSYYSRIKERIKQHWEPSIRAKVKMIFRQGRSVASSQDRVTQVVITLNSVGELERVEVITPSGIEQIDDAAVEAFRAAQPFPNPPKGLIESDGKIRIRWDFVLEASSYNALPDPNPYAKGAGDESDSTRGL